MPVIDGITLGYPATLEAPPDNRTKGYCLWGSGRRQIRLVEREGGAWETSDLGSSISWRACVELLVLQHHYRSWIPELVCEDALAALPRRWGRDLAQALGLDAIETVDNTFADKEILCWGSCFLTRSAEGAARILEHCNRLGFSARMPAHDAHLRFVSDLDHHAIDEPRATPLYRSRCENTITVALGEQDLVQQTRSLCGHVIETIRATPTHLERIRRHPPSVGSDRLKEYLRHHAASLPVAPPSAMTGAPMCSVPEDVRQLGRTLLLRPGEGEMWLGLWRLEDLPRAARQAAPQNVVVAPGSSRIVRVEWPFYTWGDIDMICLGGGPEFESYLRDATGAIWLCDVAYGHFDFVCGSTISWLERIAFNSHLDAMSHESPLLTIPLRAWHDLPGHFNVPLVPECSDPRARLYVSSTYTVWESAPPHSTPVVELRARSSRELIPVVQWAKRHWTTTKVAISGSDEALTELSDTARHEHIQILDGETGGWKATTFWDN
ncbi:hypothetical protein ACSRUE_28410 [Sorangium sp. KYC3313]|uniref:hypothetical protein n=1 Tax=Sorangium sp. KYC3313 TaxID=3449740 RepID=UPI003F88BF02